MIKKLKIYSKLNNCMNVTISTLNILPEDPMIQFNMLQLWTTPSSNFINHNESMEYEV